MERAIVLVNLKPGAGEQRIAALEGIPGILSVYELYGTYDLLVIVEGPDDQTMKTIIADNLRLKADVVSTVTLKITS
jgi:DNA-binding Lrp family transcriptional regulator